MLLDQRGLKMLKMSPPPWGGRGVRFFVPRYLYNYLKKVAQKDRKAGRAPGVAAVAFLECTYLSDL